MSLKMTVDRVYRIIIKQLKIPFSVNFGPFFGGILRKSQYLFKKPGIHQNTDKTVFSSLYVIKPLNTLCAQFVRISVTASVFWSFSSIFHLIRFRPRQRKCVCHCRKRTIHCITLRYVHFMLSYACSVSEFHVFMCAFYVYVKICPSCVSDFGVL